ncbi:unnamed protein product [Effrenium voratum]|nr:unnamed protein product [Effrenium voratum]
MAPKRDEKMSKKSEGYTSEDDDHVDPTASSSTEDASLESLVELVMKLSLEELSNSSEKHMMLAKLNFEKHKVIADQLKAINKQQNEATKKERMEASRAKAKAENRAVREKVVNINLTNGVVTHIITTPLNITVGMLRVLLGQILRLSKKKTKTMTLSVGGAEITQTPRKTLLGRHVQANSLVNYAFPDETGLIDNTDDQSVAPTEEELESLAPDAEDSDEEEVSEK